MKKKSVILTIIIILLLLIVGFLVYFLLKSKAPLTLTGKVTVRTSYGDIILPEGTKIIKDASGGIILEEEITIETTSGTVTFAPGTVIGIELPPEQEPDPTEPNDDDFS